LVYAKFAQIIHRRRKSVFNNYCIPRSVGNVYRGAVVIALFMAELESAMDGDGEFIFNAVVLSLASVLIAWTVLWMAKHGREMSMRMQQVGKSVSQGDLPAT